MNRQKTYVISLNMLKDKHKELIEWIKEQAGKEERSISSFCINILKEYKKQKDENQ